MNEIAARAYTTIIAPAEEVFDAIVQSDTITTIFPDRASRSLVEGAHVQWEFDHAKAVVDLYVTEVTRPSSIRFDWNAAKAGLKPVTFTLTSLDGATRVEVTEGAYTVTAEDAATAIQQTAGWAEFLAYLKARVQFDVELRDGRQH